MNDKEIRKAPVIHCNWYFVEHLGNPVKQVLYVLNPQYRINMKPGYEYAWMGVVSFLNAKAWWQVVEIIDCKPCVFEHMGKTYQGYRIEFRHIPEAELRSGRAVMMSGTNHQPLMNHSLRWRYA